MAIALNTVIVDGQKYKPGDVIPDFKSIKCVDTREPRKYQGLSADVSVLNDVIAKYASGGASCFMSDTGEYYEYDREEKTWKLITNITERGFDSEKAYGALKHMLKNVTVSDEKIQSAVTNYLTVNPVLPGATTEQAQQIEQNKTDVASLKEETGSLKGNVWNAITDGKCDNKGLIDCTKIVQEAINNAKDCTVLYFPKGSYFFKSNIIIERKKGLTIKGDGTDWYGTLFVTSYEYSFMQFYGGANLAVENLSIKGNDVSTSKAIAFLDNTPTTMDCRTTSTYVRHVKITRFAVGIDISCPSGYNYFDDVSISMFPASGTAFSVGALYKNTGVTETGDTIRPNYIYFTNCKADGSSREFNIDGLRVTCGQYIVVDKCDFCNMTNGVNISNNNTNDHVICDVFINNTSLYNNRIGVSISAKAEGISRVAINGCMIVTSVGVYHYALAVLKEDALKPVKNISFIGNIFRDYANTPRNFFNIPGADSESIVKIGLGC